jgi:DNA phosphorothioation-dependent restriction protein DptG
MFRLRSANAPGHILLFRQSSSSYHQLIFIAQIAFRCKNWKKGASGLRPIFVCIAGSLLSRFDSELTGAMGSQSTRKGYKRCRIA